MIGYPSWIENLSYLDRYYKDVSILMHARSIIAVLRPISNRASIRSANKKWAPGSRTVFYSLALTFQSYAHKLKTIDRMVSYRIYALLEVGLNLSFTLSISLSISQFNCTVKNIWIQYRPVTSHNDFSLQSLKLFQVWELVVDGLHNTMIYRYDLKIVSIKDNTFSFIR